MSLLSLPALLSGTLLIGLPTVAAGALVRVVRSRSPVADLRINNDYFAVIYPVVGVVYGVFLAFAIVIAWQRYSDAEASTVSEATHSAELWRDAQVFPDDVRIRIQDGIRDYLVSVRDREWDAMAEGRMDPQTESAYLAVWQAYYAFDPTGPQDMAFYATSLTQLNAVGDNRNQRILYSRGGVPALLWSFLIFGGVVTIGFSLLVATEKLWIHVVTTSLITSLIAWSLFLVMNLQHPFSGDFGLDSTPYSEALHTFGDAG